MHAQEAGEYIVLVVDDEELVRNIGCQILRRMGYDAHAVGSGAEAVEFCRAAEPAPHCLLLDYTMSELNGAETLAEIRAFMPAISAILASGYEVEDLGVDVEKEGWDGVVTKPFRLEKLAAVLDSVRGRG